MNDNFSNSKCQFACGPHTVCERFADPNAPVSGIVTWFIAPPIKKLNGQCPFFVEKK